MLEPEVPQLGLLHLETLHLIATAVEALGDDEEVIAVLLELRSLIDQVEAEMVFRPPWSPEMMSEEAKAALGFF